MKRVASVTTLAAALAIAACEAPTALDDSVPVSAVASARATTFTDNVRVPFNIDVFVPCADGGAGEVVLLSGSLHSLFHETVSGNNFKVKMHSQPQGVGGIGQTTGDQYRGTGVTQETFGGSFVNGQFSNTFVNNFRIIGQGPGNNATIHQTFHITFSASGVITAFVDNFSSDCK